MSELKKTKYAQGQANIHFDIRKIMKRRKKWKPYQIQEELAKIYSESSITARLRQMADVVCIHEMVDGKHHWFYILTSRWKVVK